MEEEQDSESRLMYKIERPVYDEAFLRSQLLHRRNTSTTLRKRLLRHFQWVWTESNFPIKLLSQIISLPRPGLGYTNTDSIKLHKQQ